LASCIYHRECSACSRRNERTVLVNIVSAGAYVLGEDREAAEIASVFADVGQCQHAADADADVDDDDGSCMTPPLSVERNVSITRRAGVVVSFSNFFVAFRLGAARSTGPL